MSLGAYVKIKRMKTKQWSISMYFALDQSCAEGLSPTKDDARRKLLVAFLCESSRSLLSHPQDTARGNQFCFRPDIEPPTRLAFNGVQSR